MDSSLAYDRGAVSVVSFCYAEVSMHLSNVSGSRCRTSSIADHQNRLTHLAENKDLYVRP